MAIEKRSKTSPESIVREIKRKTRRKFTAKEKRILSQGRSHDTVTAVSGAVDLNDQQQESHWRRG
jgi:hypothetical protein